MKNAIQYYYKMNPINIHQINKKYRFEYQNKKYILYQYERKMEDLSEIYELHSYLNYVGIYCHKIIKNINNDILTMINNNYYILLYVNIENRKIDIKDIEYLSNIKIEEERYKKINRKEWDILWANKIDYLEYQISQFGKKYKLIRESSDYYIGIVENCISLMTNYRYNTIKSITHERINKNMEVEEFYNPLNFIIDNRIRDISELLKSNINTNNNIIPDLEKYINNNNINEKEIGLIFIRILYPSIYIDKCESILNKTHDEQDIKKIISNTEMLEKNLKQIYRYLKTKYTLPEIEWLKKSE